MVIVFLGVIIIAASDRVELKQMFSDPASVSGTSPMVGLVSTAGIIVWALAAGTWFTLYLLKRGRPIALFAAASALITTIMMLDDAFMAHDYYLSDQLGLPEEIPLLGLGLIVIAYVWVYREFFKRHFAIALSASAMLGASIAIDVLFQLHLLPFALSTAAQSVIEDGAKWIGINLWFLLALRYFLDESREMRADDTGQQPSA